jgi:hypothetical protein
LHTKWLAAVLKLMIKRKLAVHKEAMWQKKQLPAFLRSLKDSYTL